MLKFNDDKTEFLTLISPFHRRKYNMVALTFGLVVWSSRPVENLVPVCHVAYHILHHVTAVCVKVNYHLRRTDSSYQYITIGKSAAAFLYRWSSLICIIVTLLSGIAEKVLDLLQRAHNLTPVAYQFHMSQRPPLHGYQSEPC